MTESVAPTGRCIHEIFEDQATRTPQCIAVTAAGTRLTYRELNERANRLAHHLRSRGVRAGCFVGVYLDRTADLIVALLAILKAGGAYVPIDPQYPQERVSFMLEDSKSALMLTQRSLGAQVGSGPTRVLIDADLDTIAHESSANLGSVAAPHDLAYVIYTSGSTGKPKGTLVTHANVVRLFESTQPWFHFSAQDVWTLFHSCAFDFSVWEIWGALFYGGRLIVVPFAISRTPSDFLRLLSEEGVTILNQTPSAFRQLVRADQSPGAPKTALRYVIFGGEALDMKTLAPWFERHGDRRPQLVNMYGITETTVHVTYRPVGVQDLDSPSLIGIPIPDLQIHLLDEQGAPVAAGVAGEIHVGGAGVARGYLNRPELTAQKFIPDPFFPNTDRRLYRSGDLGRYLPNGDLEYLGRIDTQVKIRGFRIELGEIAAVINAFPAVRDSVVIARDHGGDQRLVAYLVNAPGSEVVLADLRHALRARLPEYMVPSAFVFLERLPLTVNGKLDTQALPPPEPASAPVAEIRPLAAAGNAGSSVEETIAEVWRSVLEVPSVSVSDNFFDVGGNSVHLAAVHDRLQKRLERVFSITDLFAHPTIRSLATHFAGSPSVDPAASAARLRAQRQREALSAQRNAHRERK